MLFQDHERFASPETRHLLRAEPHFSSYLSFPWVLLVVKYKIILCLEIIFVCQEHFTLVEIKISIQFIKFRTLVLKLLNLAYKTGSIYKSNM